ncbi:MAG: long-chain fatty acid--CoA ligase [Candidatus Abyssobacteria bacterium SURF_17]|uniref:Long-chain fatty acid--CoA ligase n=1 Tax=Candidatus Abyssobacteria bacterium SURF_17 TaxID=2093361 RepID=A0A419F879_9BACT|nr:MAG: long-chain fatty acid--CoA ligase [Candidatus Abyssubacteria bacterium SURF_17]
MKKPWFRHYDYFVPSSLRYPKVPAYFMLDLAASKYKDSLATDFYGATLTYRELRSQVNKLAVALADMGIRKGDRVGLMLPNCPQIIIGYYAILRIGAIVVNVNPLYMERELEHQLNDSGTETLFCLDMHIDKARKVKETTSLKNVVVTRVTDYMIPEVRDAAGALELAAGEISFLELLERGGNRLPPVVEVGINEPAVLQYTGGTTGLSKGATLSHMNIVSNTLQTATWAKELMPLGQQVYLIVIPIFHSYGMTCGMNCGIFNGAKMILIPRFDIDQLLNAFASDDVTYFPGVPTLFTAILNHPDAGEAGLDKVALFNSGSAPLAIETINGIASLGISMTEGYGLSEASPVTHSTPILGIRKPGSIGIPFPDTDSKIVDTEDWQKELPVGKEGELIIKGPQVMLGYWNKPQETEQTLKDGWLLTGDIARMDEDGYFYIVDRKKDLIIAGGYNIYPREVDEVLYSHPKVLEAATIGVPHQYRGETVKAFIVLRPGETATAEEITAFCKENMAAYKVPKIIEFRSELPKTAVGKILRKELRAEELKKLKK